MNTRVAAAKPLALSFSEANAGAYHTVKVDGMNVFYREAGPKDAPALLLPLEAQVNHKRAARWAALQHFGAGKQRKIAKAKSINSAEDEYS